MEINQKPGAAPEKMAINKDIIPPQDIPEQSIKPEDAINPQKPVESFWKEIIKFALIAIFIIIPIRFFVVQPFIVDGNSMDNTFKNGQYLLVDELSYHFEPPVRGATIIFKYPNDHKKYFIKRVIGLPNETVIVNKDKITIKNADHPEGFTLNEPYISDELKDTRPINPAITSPSNQTKILGDNEYFVMGDNRMESSDSRYWGPVTVDLIVGRPLIRLIQFVPTTKQNYYFPLRFISLDAIGPFPGTYYDYNTK